MHDLEQPQVFEYPRNPGLEDAVAEQTDQSRQASDDGNTVRISTESSVSPRDTTSTSTDPSRPTRVPGTFPPLWIPDHQTNTCMSCDCQFTLIKRRHHCRSCGKIFCGDCCRFKAKLLYLDNKEARVCTSCYRLLETTINSNPANDSDLSYSGLPAENRLDTSSSGPSSHVQGVLKSTHHALATVNECNSSSSSSDHQTNKQVIFSDGVRPGTDLSEPFSGVVASSASISSSPSSQSFTILSRQSKNAGGSSRKSKGGKSNDGSVRNITVCDEIGYLPPIVISRDSALFKGSSGCNSATSSTFTNLISHFKSVGDRKNIQASMESRSCPLNGIMKFEDISELIGTEGVITFLLLKDYQLKVKKVRNSQTPDMNWLTQGGKPNQDDPVLEAECNVTTQIENHDPLELWCFASEGLSKFGQSEVLLVIDKDTDDPCIPRDVFKIYLTLHELALRRQSLETLGNLLFQDGLFGSRDTAGLLFVRPMATHCLEKFIIPRSAFLIAIVLQRWEVPWSKVFPMRLLLRLGHKFNCYPYPMVSFRSRDPVYYEVGHTIISILGDFRNFRYSLTHVDGLRVMIDKASGRVKVKIHHSCYQQFNKVLDSSNNEHVLAWSACPTEETEGHLVSVQNEDGHYETVEFYKHSSDVKDICVEEKHHYILGASFIIFSGALKTDQSGQSARISIVEDGLLIQIQSCTMTALRNAIHFMHSFDIDCGNKESLLNQVEIRWETPQDNLESTENLIM